MARKQETADAPATTNHLLCLELPDYEGIFELKEGRVQKDWYIN